MLTISGIGRLGKDPKMQYTPQGTAATNFSVAADCGFGDKKETVWVNLSSFGKQAEILNQYLYKGSRLVFTADVRSVRTYTKAGGETGVSLDAQVISFSFVDFNEEKKPANTASNPYSGVNEPEEF